MWNHWPELGGRQLGPVWFAASRCAGGCTSSGLESGAGRWPRLVCPTTNRRPDVPLYLRRKRVGLSLGAGADAEP